MGSRVWRGESTNDAVLVSVMDARLVWDTWRRVLTDDELVTWVLNPKASHTGGLSGFSAAEIAVLSDYASTPVPTETNIGMYRQGLVRNALSALSLVPLTRNLLYMDGLDVNAVADKFVQSTGYIDYGPNFWRTAADFVEHLAKLPEFASRLKQDVLALDSATIALARRLSVSPPEVWPENAAILFSAASPRIDYDSFLFVASRAAVATSTSYDLTSWLENPEEFDADDELPASARHWLIYFPTANEAHAYAELSSRSAHAFNLLSAPKTAAEVAVNLDGISKDQVLKAIESLMQLGVVANM